LLHLQENANSWIFSPILIYVAESLNNDRIIQIDIAKTLLGQDKGQNVPSPEKRNDDNCYWFPELFKTNMKNFVREKLSPKLRLLADKQDSKLIVDTKKWKIV
jgi:hypothetical protein